jgi:nucleoside-diphosphate-sugar epimerase
MRIFLTGGTGFTGTYVARRLIERGHAVRALVRPTSDCGSLPAGIETVRGILEDAEGLSSYMRGADALVNVASIGFGHVPGIVRAAHEARVGQCVFFSTTALFTRLNAKSKSVRIEAERVIRESGLDWTILRPTMIYGSARDRNICRLVRYLARFPVIPVFGNGRALQQPVYVDDLANAVVKVLDSSLTVRNTYNLPGAAALSFNEVIDTIVSKLGRRVRKVYLAAAPFIVTLRSIERLGIVLPIKSEQLERLNEDKSFDYGEAIRDFSYEPIPFHAGVDHVIRDCLAHSGK